jgi:hypothetical protein
MSFLTLISLIPSSVKTRHYLLIKFSLKRRAEKHLRPFPHIIAFDPSLFIIYILNKEFYYLTINKPSAPMPNFR